MWVYLLRGRPSQAMSDIMNPSKVWKRDPFGLTCCFPWAAEVKAWLVGRSRASGAPLHRIRRRPGQVEGCCLEVVHGEKGYNGCGWVDHPVWVCWVDYLRRLRISS